MKSLHEPFDDELKERLQQYTEEPNENLWQGIVSKISPVNPEPGWMGWSERISGAVVIGLTMLVGVLQFGIDIDKDLFMTSLHQIQIRNEEKPEKTITGKSENKGTSTDISVNSNNEPSDIKIVVSKSTTDPHQEEPVNLVDKDHTSITTESSNLEPATETADREPAEAENKVIQPIAIENSQIKSENFSNTENLSNTMIASDTTKIIPKQENKPDSVIVVKKQTNSNKKKIQRHKKYTLYFTAMPTFGYQRVESNQNDNIIIESIQRIPTFSSERLGVRTELGVEFPFCKNKKFKMFGGFLYYQRKQTISYTEKYLDSTLVSSGPNGEVIIEPQFGYLEKSIEYELKNIGIQLGFNYRLTKNKPASIDSKKALSSKTIPFPANKLSHTIGSGIEFHKALNKTNEFDKANGFTDPSAYVFFNFYYRMQYPSTGRLRGIFQPTLNYSFFINENLNAPFYVKPYGLGLNFGCSYNF